MGEIRKLPLPADMQWRGQKTGLGKRALASPFFRQWHTSMLAGARRPISAAGRPEAAAEGGGVVLVDVATEAALQSGAVIPLHTGFDFVAVEAQGLELQGLSLVGLAHRNDGPARRSAQ